MTTEITSPPPISLDWSADAALIDGAAVSIRPLRPDDDAALRDFFGALSSESMRLRYFSTRPGMTDAEIARLTASDPASHVHLGAFHTGRVVGVGDFIVSAPGEAEVAFVVSDDFQGRGIGSLLLEYLAELGRAAGITRFRAETMAENLRMLDVFRHAGFIERVGTPESGVVGVSLDITDTRGVRAASGERERLASVAAMRGLLEPKSVAVIGAGRTPGGIGHAILRNLIQGPFNGRVYPVNKSADHVSGVPAWASVGDIPGKVDLAVIAVPVGAVLATVRECGRAGVGSLVIITSGYGETGADGAAKERELLDVARGYGMRLVGPNCMGIINTDPAIRLNTTFAPTQPPPGNMAFFTQSGALGVAVIDEAAQLRHRAVRLRLRRQQDRHLGQRPAPVLGAGRPHRRDPPLPRILRQSNSASRRSRAGSRGASRSSPSRVAGARPGRAPPPRTPPRWPPPTSPSTPSSASRASSGSPLSSSSSTWPEWSPRRLAAGNRVAVVGNAGGAAS